MRIYRNMFKKELSLRQFITTNIDNGTRQRFLGIAQRA